MAALASHRALPPVSPETPTAPLPIHQLRRAGESGTCDVQLDKRDLPADDGQ
jgi:hypothetical protein